MSPRRPKTPATAAPPPERAMSREKAPTCGNQPDCPEKPDAFSLSEGDLGSWFSFVRPTLKMSRAPQRHDRTDGQARRLHFAVGRLGRARDSPTPTPETEPTLEQPAERRAVTPAMVKPDRPCWDCTSRSPRTSRVTPFMDGARTTAPRRRHGVLNHPSRGAGTPPTAATRFGDCTPRCETSPMIRTTRHV